jgi:transglutaminase-like putative cysteine protease
MRFSVRHDTVYRYSGPIRLAPHVLRLNPRPDAGKLLSRRLTIDPAPVRREEALDAHGNLFTRVYFEGKTQVFRIDSRFELETAEVKEPFGAAPPNAVYLGGGLNAAVAAFAAGLAEEVGGDALNFLDRLNERLFADIRHDIRANGAARPPEETLALGHGACRDVTILFLAACRSFGLPARFVSGYQALADTPDGRRHLHAWPEAFVPGFGWRGYDPTHGLKIAGGHVALSAAASQGETMPVEGGYFGDGVNSTLDYEVEIATSDA